MGAAWPRRKVKDARGAVELGYVRLSSTSVLFHLIQRIEVAGVTYVVALAEFHNKG
ncbi:unnamed protein product [marine sediment metagenome]|uniref:Uncharacterized protein n=1 Tax=marine sediment metagenome TaxID=412755 RepID=X1GCI7_9ZZZZ